MKEEYQKGSFIAAIAASRSHDYEEQQWGKAQLRDMGLVRAKAMDGAETTTPWMTNGGIDTPLDAKATLGSTDATGGYIIRNNLVDDFIKPAAYRAWFRQWER
jgi:hypothetical protein